MSVKQTRKPTSGHTIQIVKREVVGSFTYDRDGNVDLLAHLAEVAMQDARDSMRTDAVSESHYEIDEDGAVTSVTIKHTPSDLANPPMTVEQAQAALSDARRRERAAKDDGAVPMEY